MTPIVKLINLLKKGLPATTAPHAEYSVPMTDWRGFSCILSFFKHVSMSVVHLFSSIATESSSKPRKVITWVGRTVLSGAVGMPMSAHMDINSLS